MKYASVGLENIFWEKKRLTKLRLIQCNNDTYLEEMVYNI